MGLFDLFKTSELEERHKRALSRHFNPENIKSDEHEKGLKNLAGLISNFSSETTPDEEVLLITTNSLTWGDIFKDYAYLITNKRLVKLSAIPDPFTDQKTQILPLENIADIRIKVYSSGTHNAYILSHAALPYQSVLDGDRSYAMEFFQNSLLFELASAELVDEFHETLKNAIAQKTGNNLANPKTDNNNISALEQLKKLIDDYIKIKKENFVIQEQGKLLEPRQDQLDLDKEIRNIVKTAKVAGDHETVSKAQAYYLKSTKGLPEHQADDIKLSGNRLFGTFFKDTKKETLEDMIDNIVKAWSVPLIYVISDEELQEMVDELTKAAKAKIEAGDLDSISQARKHLFTEETTMTLSPEAREQLEKFLPAALAGAFV